MKVRTKVLAFAAATTLSIGMTSGAVADGTVTATLAQNPSGECTASVTGSQGLGEFTWTAGGFGAATGTVASTLKLTVTQTYYTTWNCTISVSSAGLTGSNGGLLPITITGAPTGPAAVDEDGVVYDLTASVSPDDSLPVGAYSGTIVVDSASGS